LGGLGKSGALAGEVEDINDGITLGVDERHLDTAVLGAASG
jgi:hypothetical protein